MNAKIETVEAWSARAKAICEMINECRPASLEPFAAILSAAQMKTLRAIDGAGWLTRCADTGRYFVPGLYGRA